MVEKTGSSLFDSELVFVEHATNQEELFTQIAEKLEAKGAVKRDFLANILTREKNYPTGIDMSVVGPEYPNVAIPHTEGEFVNRRLIVPVKLDQPIEFSNMIDPSQSFPVSFLFMILNNDPEGQANVLAQIMDFLTQTPESELLTLFDSEDANVIYKTLETHFEK